MGREQSLMTVRVRPEAVGQVRPQNCPEAVIRLGSVWSGSAGEVEWPHRLSKSRVPILRSNRLSGCCPENVGCTYQYDFCPPFAWAVCVFANFRAASSVSMNSVTLMGLVR